MTFREVEQACRGYEVRLARSREMERFIASVLINANLKKGRQQVRPEDIMPLVTDKRTVRKSDLMTAERYKEVIEMFDKAQWQSQN